MAETSNLTGNGKPRLFALDLLRGMDMFLLVCVGAPMRAIQRTYHCFPDGVWRHFRHAWLGFGFWDIIMPLFIFMCGAAIPFALEKRMKDGRPTLVFWRHVLGRVALLWVFGMICQGHLLSFDPNQISPYNNTLQTIAAGYLITALALCVPSMWFRRVLPIVLAAVYTALLAWGGDYSKSGNFANQVEMKVLALLVPEGSGAFTTYDYTWFLTSLMFGAMTLCGYHSTKILQSARAPWQKVGTLAVLAVVLLVVGFVSVRWIPVIKPIFTLSFTAQAMGWCVLALAALYALTDILKLRRGLGLFILLGQHSLFAYMVCHFASIFDAASNELLGGLALWIGQTPMPVVLAVCGSFLHLGAVWIWDRLRRA